MAISDNYRDVEEIKRLRADYFFHVDNHAWKEFEDLFRPDVKIDFSKAGAIEQPSLVINGAAEFVKATREFVETTKSVHHGMNPRIDLIDETHARGTWSVHYVMVIPESDDLPPDWPAGCVHSWGYYYDEYEKTPDGWRFSAVTEIATRHEHEPPAVKSEMAA